MPFNNPSQLGSHMAHTFHQVFVGGSRLIGKKLQDSPDIFSHHDRESESRLYFDIQPHFGPGEIFEPGHILDPLRRAGGKNNAWKALSGLENALIRNPMKILVLILVADEPLGARL